MKFVYPRNTKLGVRRTHSEMDSLLINLSHVGGTGRESIWLVLRAHGPRCPPSLCTDLEPNISPPNPPA